VLFALSPRVALAHANLHAGRGGLPFLHCGTVWLFRNHIPKGFIPQQDVGIIAATTESGCRYIICGGLAGRQQALLQRFLDRTRKSRRCRLFIEPSHFNQGRIYIHLEKPFGQRHSSGWIKSWSGLRSQAAEVRGVSLARACRAGCPNRRAT